MKKMLIITSVVLVLGAGAVWIYLLLYGAPKGASDVFSNFGFGTTDEPEFSESPSTIDTSPIDQNGAVQPLRQLTSRPVIGAISTTNGIRYVEQGTGHVYGIAFGDGSETLISGTTIPKAAHAVFAPTGDFVAITSDEDGTERVVVAPIGNETGGEGKTLPVGAYEVSFSEVGDKVFYLVPNENGATAYSYTIAKETNGELFTIPLRDVRVLWGEPTYIFTIPSSLQKGAIYSIKKGNLSYVAPSNLSLFGTRYEKGLVITHAENGGMVSYIQGEDATPLPINVIPEKCTYDRVATSTVYCASPTGGFSDGFPDMWYQGVVSYADNLFRIELETGSATLFSNMEVETGREIDVMDMGVSSDSSYLYFINKNDGSLWVYDLIN